jgi:hypothetical protein
MAQVRWVNAAIVAGALFVGLALYALGIRPVMFLWNIAFILALGVAYGRRRPTAFVADGHSFAALPRLSAGVPPAVWIAAAVTECLAVLASHGMGDFLFFVPLGAVLLVERAVRTWRPPFVVLTPEGVVRRLWIRTRGCPWADLTEPVTLHGEVIKLRLGGHVMNWSVAGSGLAIHAGFLANAIEYYRLVPEFRAAIGTEAEHVRLTQALEDWVRMYAVPV